MHIAIFTNNYLPNPYGVSTSIETFRADFERLGHQVFIFAPRWPGYTDENPNVFRYPSWDLEIKIKFPLAIPYSWKIDRILDKLDLDIIHSQHPNLLGSAAKKWARKKKIPLVFTWHTLYDQYTNFVPFIPAGISAGFMIRKAVKFANHADTVVVPTNSIIPILRKWGVKKEMVPIVTGVVEKDFDRVDKSSIRNEYNVKDDEILLLLVSRLTAEKNILFIANAVKKILKENSKVKLLVAGGGYLSSEIIKIAENEGIADKIIITGELSHEKIADYFAAGDIFIYGSKSETQGMVITEAMYMGLPIVAVDATGTSSLVKNDENGFLVSENEEEFSGAVEKLIKDKNLREQFGQASKKIAEEHFTSDVCAKKMLEVYEKAIMSLRA